MSTATSTQPVSSIAGDVDGDGVVSASDGRALLDYLFRGAATPRGISNADANGDGQVNLSDAIAIFNLINGGSAAMAAPPEQLINST